MLQPLSLHPRTARYRYACGATAEHATLDPARRAVEPRCAECTTRMRAVLEAMPEQQIFWFGPLEAATRQRVQALLNASRRILSAAS